MGYRATVVRQGVVELQAFDPPQPLPGQILVRTTTTLISPGTERAFFLSLPNTAANYPLYPGYSNISEVVGVGAGVDGFAVGDRVASTAQHTSHAVVDAKRCLRVPANLPDETASFFNLIAIAMQGIHKARIELGESVLVVGMGLIGLFALQLAKLAGGLPVIGVDQDNKRLALASACGADAVFKSDSNLAEALGNYLDTDGPNVVIEATGASSPILQAFQLAGQRGRVILLGSARGETEQVNFYRDVHRKGLTIIGAHEMTRPQHDSSAGWWTQIDEHRTALQLLAHHRLIVEPLISHRFDWQDFPKAYALLSEWDTNALGMIIRW